MRTVSRARMRAGPPNEAHHVRVPVLSERMYSICERMTALCDRLLGRRVEHAYLAQVLVQI
jgi:hypothetical protein